MDVSGLQNLAAAASQQTPHQQNVLVSATAPQLQPQQQVTPRVERSLSILQQDAADSYGSVSSSVLSEPVYSAFPPPPPPGVPTASSSIKPKLVQIIESKSSILARQAQQASVVATQAQQTTGTKILQCLNDIAARLDALQLAVDRLNEPPSDADSVSDVEEMEEH